MTARNIATSGTTLDTVYQALRTAIISGDFNPGQPLRQEDLAKRYGTSRIPIREALRQLEMEGFVSYLPRRGAVVADVSLTDVLEIMDIRIALECRALRLAIPNMTDSDFAHIEEILRTADESDNIGDWDRLNRNFHLSLYEPADRPRLLALIQHNFDNRDRFARFHVARATGGERPHREHRDIYKACRDGQADRAAALLESHIAYAQKALATSVRRGRIGLVGD